MKAQTRKKFEKVSKRFNDNVEKFKMMFNCWDETFYRNKRERARLANFGQMVMNDYQFLASLGKTFGKGKDFDEVPMDEITMLFVEELEEL